MKKYLERVIDPSKLIPHVQLTPESLEYWQQRGNTHSDDNPNNPDNPDDPDDSIGSSSIYKRTQSQADRVCTIEAIALLLLEMGEAQSVCDSLIEYVAVNNAAISPDPS